MAWVRLDDGFLDHPKFLRAGPLAGHLNICAIAWANRNLTDGFIPDAQVARLANWDGIAHRVWQGELVGGGDEVSARELAEQLVEAGLWRHVDRGYEIHGYHDWQKPADEIRRLSAARADAGRKGGTARQGAGSDETESSTSSSPDETEGRHAATNPGANPEANRQANGKRPPSKAEPEVRSKKEEGTTSSSSLCSEDVELAKPILPREQVTELLDYWRQQCNHPKARPTVRAAKIAARLREGYSAADIRQGIDGAARAAFVDDRGKRHDDLELICRNGAKLEDFMARATAPSPNGRSGRHQRVDESEAIARRGLDAIHRMRTQGEEVA